MSHFVYVLKSATRNYLYVGMTDNLERRLSQHNSGSVRSTQFYKPFTIVYVEECANRIAARVREKYLKSGCGKEFIKAKM